MWIFTTRGFYSIVQSPVPGRMLVRARFNGDIEALLPGAEVSETPERDYMYRTIVPTEDVITALAKVTQTIDYPNFKDAVLDDRRHPAYGNVWGIMYNAGDNRPRNLTSWYSLIPSDDPPFVPSRRPTQKKKRNNRRK